MSNANNVLNTRSEVRNDIISYLQSNRVKLAVIGNTKAGKSTLLNSILQQTIFKVGEKLETNAFYKLEYH